MPIRHDVLALVAFAPTTRDGVKNSKADEIWTLNWAYNYDFVPRVDRLFEMHPIWLYKDAELEEWVKPREHWKWLQDGDKGYPIYMLLQISSIPSNVRYPIEEVKECIFGNRYIRMSEEGREEAESRFFTSSFDYMIALAILEHEKYGWWNRIELYGFEMGSNTEYQYQRSGGHFFLGQAMARGIQIVVPNNSRLMLGKMYGYEGGQMIFRQDLERHAAKYDRKRVEAIARLNYLEGQLNLAFDSGKKREDLEEEIIRLRDARDTAVGYSTAYQVIDLLIREVDLEEVEIEITKPLDTVPLEEPRELPA